MKKNIESRVADTVLQRNKEIVIGDQTYEIAPPTTATLILVSELVATMPTIKLNSESIIIESLMIAKDCKPLGDIMAVLILGAKNIREKKTITTKRLWGLIKETCEIPINKQAELAELILQNISPKELNKIVVELLMGMEVADFFDISTSLIKVNLTRETREVEKTTASGR